jgi:hypothetical protein
MDVLAHPLFAAWLSDLASISRPEAMAINNVINLLRLKGVSLGFPWSSALVGTTHPLRELRPRQGASPYRVIYAFDPDRNAIILLGGHKQRGIYTSGLRQAEHLWLGHLKAIAALRIRRDKKGAGKS